MGDCNMEPMFKFCGFASMQHHALCALDGHEVSTFERNSKMPSCQAWLTKRWQSKPSGFSIKAQLILPACAVTGLMYCSFTT